MINEIYEIIDNNYNLPTLQVLIHEVYILYNAFIALSALNPICVLSFHRSFLNSFFEYFHTFPKESKQNYCKHHRKCEIVLSNPFKCIIIGYFM